MKIAMIFDGLQVGGIERVGADYAKLFVQLGHEIEIINLSPHLREMEKEFPEKCRIIRVNYPRKFSVEQYEQLVGYAFSGRFIYPIVTVGLTAWNALYKLFCRLKNGLDEEYDLAIAFSGHFNDLTFVANNFVKCKAKVCWLHGAEFEYRMISEGYFNLYKKIKNLVCLSELCDIECKKFNEKNDIRKFKIYNPTSIRQKEIDVEKVKKIKDQYGEFCLMVGRLTPDKDQITAIKAVEYLNKTYKKDIKLLLVGDGNTRSQIEKFIKEKNLEEWIFLIGQKDDVQNYYAAANIYVHSSPMEGLPTVLLEAMHFHLPIVSTDSIPGVREILGNSVYGLISPVYDYVELGNNIYRVMVDEGLREKLSRAGEKRIVDFSPENIRGELEVFLKEICGK